MKRTQSHKTGQKRPWNHIDRINRCQRYSVPKILKTAESAFLNSFFLSTLKRYNLARISVIHLIDSVQLFELFSAVESVSQISKTGKICFSSFCLNGQKSLCEMGILKFC